MKAFRNVAAYQGGRFRHRSESRGGPRGPLPRPVGKPGPPIGDGDEDRGGVRRVATVRAAGGHQVVRRGRWVHQRRIDRPTQLPHPRALLRVVDGTLRPRVVRAGARRLRRRFPENGAWSRLATDGLSRARDRAGKARVARFRRRSARRSHRAHPGAGALHRCRANRPRAPPPAGKPARPVAGNRPSPDRCGGSLRGVGDPAGPRALGGGSPGGGPRAHGRRARAGGGEQPAGPGPGSPGPQRRERPQRRHRPAPSSSSPSPSRARRATAAASPTGSPSRSCR